MKGEATQLALTLTGWGGRRPGAGRKPKRLKPGVAHTPRMALASRFPVLVTLRAERHVGSLRIKHKFREIRRAFERGNGRFGLRLTHYSVQRDHLHLIVEAKDRRALSRGMQGLSIRMAKAINRALGRRRGRVFSDRYHDRILRTPRQVRHALAYTLTNARKHGVEPRSASKRWVDFYSSAPWFNGWNGPIEVAWSRALGTDPPIAEPHTWLLRKGWRRHGLIDPFRPASVRQQSKRTRDGA